MGPVNQRRPIFERGVGKTLPKNGGWKLVLPVFGGFARAPGGVSCEKLVFGLVWGLHVLRVFEIKSLTRVLD